MIVLSLELKWNEATYNVHYLYDKRGSSVCALGLRRAGKNLYRLNNLGKILTASSRKIIMSCRLSLPTKSFYLMAQQGENPIFDIAFSISNDDSSNPREWYRYCGSDFTQIRSVLRETYRVGWGERGGIRIMWALLLQVLVVVQCAEYTLPVSGEFEIQS